MKLMFVFLFVFLVFNIIFVNLMMVEGKKRPKYNDDKRNKPVRDRDTKLKLRKAQVEDVDIGLLHLILVLTTIKHIQPHARPNTDGRTIHLINLPPDYQSYSFEFRPPMTHGTRGTRPPTTTKAKRRGPYVSPGKWTGFYSLGSSNEWRSMQKNPNIEYKSHWYKFIYSSEESYPYYSCSDRKTSAVWKKIRNTRMTTSYNNIRRASLYRARAQFDKAKRKQAHQEWLERNKPKPIDDEDYRAYVRKVLWLDMSRNNESVYA
ncbi:hypothetical protein WDU94_002331 [Cyamophila willieti]